jgi:hypothetical protein
MSTPISLTDPDGASADDSSFIAGTFLADAGSGDDSWFNIGPVIADTASGDDSSVTVTVTVPLADTATADDLPWQYDSVGAALFPYYAQISDTALTRVTAGDQFLWLAGT